MNSQKFMLIALILLAMIQGANPGEIFTGASAVAIRNLYPGIRDAFRIYATEIASAQATDEGQRLQVEVAAYNALTTEGAVVSYFHELDPDMQRIIMQEIFEGLPPTEEEVSQVWGMITSFFKSFNEVIGIIKIEATDFMNEATDFISLIQDLFSRDSSAALNALAQLTMVAKCLEIVYKGTTVISNVATRAISAASNCGRVTLGVLRGLYQWRRSGEIVIRTPTAASAASVSAASAPDPEEDLLNLIAQMPDSMNNTTVDEILQLKGTIHETQYINLINALTNNGFVVDDYSRRQARIRSLPYTLPSVDSARMPMYIDDQRQRSVSADAAFPLFVSSVPSAASAQMLPPGEFAAAAIPINSGDERDFRYETKHPEQVNYGSQNQGSGEKRKRGTGGRTKKHLKKKKNQRKSVRKQRKTKRGKRGRSRKSRRYKK